MKKHISTAVVFFTSALGFLFLGLPSIIMPKIAGSNQTAYDILKLESTEGFPKDMVSAVATCKVAIIALIVLFSIAMAYSVVKLLIDLKVIKIKNTAWTEWVNLGLVALITVFSIVALCGVSSFLSSYASAMEVTVAQLKEFGMYMGYGVISALVVYCLVLAVEIAWNVVLTLQSKKK